MTYNIGTFHNFTLTNICMKLNAIYTSGGQVLEEIAGAADCLILIFPYTADSIGK